MLRRNTPGQGVFLFARIFATGLGKTGDSANITGSYSLDGIDHPGGFAAANPTEISGGGYWQPLTRAETNGDAYGYRWASTTSGVVIEPRDGFTMVEADGVIASATADTITLPATDGLGNAIADDGTFANTLLFIQRGTGAGGYYTTAEPTANPREYDLVSAAGAVTLDSTSEYVVIGIRGNAYNADGRIAAATATTITLPTETLSGSPIPDDGRYQDFQIRIQAGTGAGQVPILTTPTGSPRQYNVLAGTMPVMLDTTSQFQFAGTISSRLDFGQAVPTSNTAQTVGDALNAARADGFGKGDIVTSGGVTTETLYAPDGTTPVKQFHLDSASNPTTRTPI